MTNIASAQNTLLLAVEEAPHMKRPERTELKVGDTVAVSRPNYQTVTGTVSKIGPKWITVGEGLAALRFGRETWRGAHGYGIGQTIRTPEQYVYDQRIRAARERLRSAGLTINYQQDVPDGHLVAIAALLDRLEAR